MNYKVLYRKYRPDSFENVVGQDYIITILKNSIINKTISHAYLFSGSRGTGKTSTAKILAKAVNCLNPENGSPCGKCEFCLNFKDNPDIVEIDAASNRGVNEVRTIIDNVKYTPTNGKYKVYIVDEAHMLTDEAFNALLLTLEEPPAHVIFILATTNVESIPITILSRCQRFDFQKIKIEEIEKEINNICQKESIKITSEAVSEIAYLSEGGMRDALSLLDQLSKNGSEITLDLIENEIKTVSQRTIKKLIDTIENNDIEQFLIKYKELENRAVNYKNLVKNIIDYISKKALQIKKTGKIHHLTFEDCKNLILELSDSLLKISINVNSFTILEMILLKYFDNNIIKDEKIIKEEIVQQNANAEEKDLNINNDELKKIRINNCFVNAKKSSLEIAKKELTNILDDDKIEGKIRTLLSDSTVVASSETNLILTCFNSHNVNNANKELLNIEKLFAKIVQKKYKMIFLTNEEWNLEKEKYIKNIKNNVKYEYINENLDNENVKEDLPKINEVFDVSKVEII